MSSSCTTIDNTVYVNAWHGQGVALSVDLDAASGEVDIAGWTFLAAIADAGGAVVGAFTCTPTDEAAGLLALSLSVAEVNALPLGDYGWSLLAADDLLNERELVDGALRVREAD